MTIPYIAMSALLLIFVSAANAEESVGKTSEACVKGRLDALVEQVQKNSIPLSAEELSRRPDWERNAYEIVESFYHTENLAAIASGIGGDTDIIKALTTEIGAARYWLMPPYLRVQTVEDIDGDGRPEVRENIARDFRPDIDAIPYGSFFSSELFRTINDLLIDCGAPELTYDDKKIQEKWSYEKSNDSMGPILFDAAMSEANFDFLISGHAVRVKYQKLNGYWVQTELQFP
ncbi:hypothetical protein [Methylococcus sp. EFPC2]|uniref:hypothetical protein n=1 Tax=Methylococcus sp. EFPC2 TaxID=2812648 RepID=UPI0019687077|nr:hypothetical protein [Methylococcus sp. EFPC2]QSA96689.1 hypothetical protein JWZ97_15980 [Methylococcus sp. EFPC2]